VEQEMKTYTISYTQTAFWTMEVEAFNEDSAIKKAQEIYQDDTSEMEWGQVTDSFYQCEGEA
jgi:hypothetical protein